MITEKEFIEMTKKIIPEGIPPEQDDLERCNCPNAGKIGHEHCGICIHNLPRFMCGKQH